MAYKGLIEQYRKYLPVSKNTPVITLLEGNTPLINVPKIAKKIGPKVELYVKFEGLNPTGSFKDRGMTMAISKAKGLCSFSKICNSSLRFESYHCR